MQLAKSTGGESHVHTCQGLGYGELPNGHFARPSPVVNTLVRKGKWVFEILHQALGVRPGWPHGIRVLAIEHPIGWTRISRVGCIYHFLQCRKAADRYGGFFDETPTSGIAHNYFFLRVLGCVFELILFMSFGAQ